MPRLRTILIHIYILCQVLCVINGLVKHQKVTKNQKPHHLAYFYDSQTNRTLRPPVVSFEGESYDLKQLRPTFGRRCECKESANRQANVCSCCAGLKLPRIKFQREMCTRFQYNQSKRNQMLMDVTMNGNAVASQTFNCKDY